MRTVRVASGYAALWLLVVAVGSSFAWTAIRQALKEKCAMIPLNEEAFAWGARAVRGN